MTYENKSCRKDSCFLTLQIKLWRKYNGKKSNMLYFLFIMQIIGRCLGRRYMKYIDEINKHSERPLPK